MTNDTIRTLIERLRTQNTEIGDRSDVEDVMREAADALSELTASDGDARERLIESIAGGTISTPGGYGELARDDAENIVDTILSDPVLSRAAAPEPEWEYVGQAYEANGFMRYQRENLPAEEVDSWRALMAGFPRVEVLRRIRAVPAGPWEPLPVGGETDGE